MKSYLWYLIVSILFIQTSAFSPKDKIYKHKSLGFQIKYRDADDFDDERRVPIPYSKWQAINISQLKLRVTIPPEFTVKMEQSRLAKIVRLGNKGSEGSNAIQIYFTDLSFPQIAEENNFVLVDSSGEQVWLKEGTSSQINWALEHNSWASLGRQGMTEEADVLIGNNWKGIRGSNFTGYYNENGYAGLQRCTSSFLVYSVTPNYNLVCSYTDAQLNSNPMSESEFYDIVSSIEIFK